MNVGACDFSGNARKVSLCIRRQSSEMSKASFGKVNIGKQAATAAYGGSVRRRVLRDNIHGINKAAIQRVGYRAGVKAFAGDVYDRSRSIVAARLRLVLRRAVLYAQHTDTKTISARHIQQALRHNNRIIYGYSTC